MRKDYMCLLGNQAKSMKGLMIKENPNKINNEDYYNYCNIEEVLEAVLIVVLERVSTETLIDRGADNNGKLLDSLTCHQEDIGQDFKENLVREKIIKGFLKGQDEGQVEVGV